MKRNKPAQEFKFDTEDGGVVEYAMKPLPVVLLLQAQEIKDNDDNESAGDFANKIVNEYLVYLKLDGEDFRHEMDMNDFQEVIAHYIDFLAPQK